MAVTKALYYVRQLPTRPTVYRTALVVLIAASEPTKQLNRLQHLCHRLLIMYIGFRTSQYILQTTCYCCRPAVYVSI